MPYYIIMNDKIVSVIVSIVAHLCAFVSLCFNHFFHSVLRAIDYLWAIGCKLLHGQGQR